jgi:hypothetical protein
LDDELGGEWADALDVLHDGDGLFGVDGAQARGVEPAVEGRLGDRVLVLGLACG